MATYGYVRVSTAEQAADDRTSLESQQRRIEGLAQALELTIDRMFVEPGVSGAKRLQDRPEGAKLCALLQRGDNLIAAKLDRLFRSAGDALTTSEELKARGVNLYILDMGTEPVTTSGSARLFFGMLALVAEFERHRIQERVADGRAEKRARNGHIGGAPPFGWRVEGRGAEAVLVPVPEQQAAIPRIREMAGRGLSLRAISAALAAEGLRISHQGVKRVLARTAL